MIFLESKKREYMSEIIEKEQSDFPKMKVSFLGAVGTVTGSCTMLDYITKDEKENDSSYKFFVDAGSYQGESYNFETNKHILELAPSIKKIYITHAHIDHIGFLPDIMKAGFTGKICCTKATASLMLPLLYDAMKITGKHPVPEAICEILDKIKNRLYIFDQTEDFVWGQKLFPVTQGVQVGMLRSGHVLGSVSYYFRYLVKPELDETDLNRWKIVHFSGDIGASDSENECSLILKEPSTPFYSQQSSAIILESTYGSRTRTKENLIEKRQKILFDIIEETYKNGGSVLIPAFAFNRAQEILIDLECISRNHPIENPQTAPEKDVLEKSSEMTLVNFIKKYPKLTENDVKNILQDEKINYKGRMKIKDLSTSSRSKVFSKVQELYAPSEDEKTIPRDLNISYQSKLISNINKSFIENLFDSFMLKDGLIKTKYLNMKIFERLGIESPSDEDDADTFDQKILKLKNIISKVLYFSSEMEAGKKSQKNQNTFKKQKQSVIIASSGMCDDGMVLSILPSFLKDPTCTVVLTGYQAENTNGLLLKQISEGKLYDNKQYMYNKHFNDIDLRLSNVKCKIIDMAQYYSGHADCEQLCNYVHGKFGQEKQENIFETRIFLNHGSEESRIALKEKIENINSLTGHKIFVELPRFGVSYELL